ncbi:MAG TPA: phenylalanine--tRNA ligase subunit beta [Candidatus Paceibacterota bacterium]
MKISRNWLQSFFDAELPSAEKLAEALTFHAFEIEGVEQTGNDAVLEVKITPNRGHDCLSHRGIAKELSAILNVPLARDSLSAHQPLTPDSNTLSVTIENRELCPAYAAAVIKGVSVGSSPDWLKERLESIGQRSINNVVDATNYVMFELGQPLHAFDMGKMANKDGMYEIVVRNAKKGEKLIALDGKSYELSPEHLCIVDAVADAPIGIAGIKGGKPAEINQDTHDIIIESANFNAVAIRKSAGSLKLRTDASVRFEHELAPGLTAYGLFAAVELITKVAGGTLEGFFDIYAEPEEHMITLFASDTNKVLGTNLTVPEIEDIFKRFGFSYQREGERFTMKVPFERLDLRIKEDLIEEIGRIAGFDKVPATELGVFSKKPEINDSFSRSENIRQELVSKGYSEVITSVFSKKGEQAVQNKVDSVKSFLRTTLLEGLTESYEKNLHNKELLGIEEVKLFEIGVVWGKDSEETLIGTISEKEKAAEMPLEKWDSPEPTHFDILSKDFDISKYYKPFSVYPFALRDIALFVPEETTSEEILVIIKKEAGELLVRSTLFDEFKKEGKISYAYHLVFQSMGKTLSDEEVNKIMEKISVSLGAKGWQVR